MAPPPPPAAAAPAARAASIYISIGIAYLHTHVHRGVCRGKAASRRGRRAGWQRRAPSSVTVPAYLLPIAGTCGGGMVQWARGSQAVGHKDIRRQRGSGQKRAGTCARGRSGPRGSNRRPVNIIIAERARAKGNGGSPPLHSKTAPYHSCLHTGKQRTGDGCAHSPHPHQMARGHRSSQGRWQHAPAESRPRCKPLTCSAYLPFP